VVRSSFVSAFGEKVRAARLERGYSQEELAALAGLHRTAISLIEGAERSSTLTTVEKLARALEVQPAELMPPLALPRRRR